MTLTKPVSSLTQAFAQVLAVLYGLTRVERSLSFYLAAGILQGEHCNLHCSR